MALNPFGNVNSVQAAAKPFISVNSVTVDLASEVSTAAASRDGGFCSHSTVSSKSANSDFFSDLCGGFLKMFGGRSTTGLTGGLIPGGSQLMTSVKAIFGK